MYGEALILWHCKKFILKKLLLFSPMIGFYKLFVVEELSSFLIEFFKLRICLFSFNKGCRRDNSQGNVIEPL